MNGFVEGVKARVPQQCAVNDISGDGCKVKLTDAPSPRLIVDMDCPVLPVPTAGKRCDFLFVSADGGTPLVLLLELKKGAAEAGELAAQLQGGANFAEGLIPRGSKVRFVAVAVYGGRLHPIQRQSLKKPQCKVRFRGIGHEIQLIRCGDPLKKAIRVNQRREASSTR